jgi:hypothetical protein
MRAKFLHSGAKKRPPGSQTRMNPGFMLIDRLKAKAAELIRRFRQFL